MDGLPSATTHDNSGESPLTSKEPQRAGSVFARTRLKSLLKHLKTGSPVVSRNVLPLLLAQWLSAF